MTTDTETFKPLPLFAAQLSHDLKHDECLLSLPVEKAIKLSKHLSHNYYTYLTLGDGCDFETVKVRKQKNYLVLERGKNKRDWPCGTCIEFHLTECGIEDMLYQAVPPEPDDAQEPCGFNGTVCIGKWNYIVKNGWLSHRESTNRDLRAGYKGEHAEICLDEDGCLESVVATGPC